VILTDKEKDERREFWRHAYLQGKVGEGIARADQALSAYDKQFYPDVKAHNSDNIDVGEGYRVPTRKDLPDGPIPCQVRDMDWEEWRPCNLIDVLGDPGICAFRASYSNSADEYHHYAQCRIRA